MEKDNVVKLTEKEFYILMGAFDSNHVIGLKDPFQGYLVEEMEEEIKAVTDSLEEKEYIFKEDEEIYFDNLLRVILSICSISNTTLYFNVINSNSNSSVESYFHFTQEAVIERVIDHSTQMCELEIIGDPEIAFNELTKRIELKKASVNQKMNFDISIDTFITLKTKNWTFESLLSFLERLQFSKETLSLFAFDFVNKKYEIQLSIATWDEEFSEWKKSDYYYILSESGCWCINLHNFNVKSILFSNLKNEMKEAMIQTLPLTN